MKDALGHGSNGRGGGDATPAHMLGMKAALAAKENGTFDQYGRNPQAGYMVGGAGRSRYTGAWTDDKTGTRYVEKSTHVNSEVLARSMGRMRNQISVYDLGRQHEIATHGNGNWTPH